MRRPNIAVLLLFGAAGAFAGTLMYAVQGQTTATATPAEAPAGFDNKTNGFIPLQADFNAAKQTFQERDKNGKGLGPVYNAQSCTECHQTPVTGGTSQVTELRAGHLDGYNNFVDAPGGSLINDRAIDAAIQEYVPKAENIVALRLSTNTLGLGYVEAIDSQTLLDIAKRQPDEARWSATGKMNLGIAGQAIYVTADEDPNHVPLIGRFGWKDQHASLLSFAADAYLNEIGITSRLQTKENTSMGYSVASYDKVADPEDEGDIDIFASFMRSTKAPPRDPAIAGTADLRAHPGRQAFNKVGCNACHVESIVTSPAGTPSPLFPGDPNAVPPVPSGIPSALGNKIIFPFSDFLLHDIGTGDGIVQNGGQSTASKLRTSPLWGLRTRSRHMHDGLSVTYQDSIKRHSGEADKVMDLYRALSAAERQQLLAFLGLL